jgi:hypothetical protein
MRRAHGIGAEVGGFPATLPDERRTSDDVRRSHEEAPEVRIFGAMSQRKRQRQKIGRDAAKGAPKVEYWARAGKRSADVRLFPAT